MSRWVVFGMTMALAATVACSRQQNLEPLAGVDAETAAGEHTFHAISDPEPIDTGHDIVDYAGHHDGHAPPHHAAHRDAAGHDADHAAVEQHGHAGQDDHGRGASDAHRHHPDAASDVRPTGTVIGQIEAIEDSGDRHIKVFVLAPGEERAREYYVYNQPDLLAIVRTGKVGDTVEISWVQTNHGPAIETFDVLE